MKIVTTAKKLIVIMLLILLSVACSTTTKTSNVAAVPLQTALPTPTATVTPIPTVVLAENAFSTIDTTTGKVDSTLVNEDIIVEVSVIYKTILLGDTTTWTNGGSVIGEGGVPEIGSMKTAGINIHELDLPITDNIVSPCMGAGYRMTQGFNPSGGHSGYDIVCGTTGQGAPVGSLAECVIWRTFDNLGYDQGAEDGLTWDFDVSGRTVVCASKIRVENLPESARGYSSAEEVIILTISGHLMFEDGNTFPQPGDLVQVNTQIGRQGNTGYTSGGEVTRYSGNNGGAGTHVHNSIVILTENGNMYHVNPSLFY